MKSEGGLARRLSAALKKRDAAGLARAARGAGPEALVRVWADIPPTARVAAFRALPPRLRARAFAALDGGGRWLAYLGSTSEGAAPLLDGAPASLRHSFPLAGARAAAAMRRALAREGA